MWDRLGAGAVSRRAVQATMGLFLVSGLIGLALHSRGAAEFQLEIDPSISRADLIRKVIHAKAPPILAPGVMFQLGLLGLVYTYRYDR
jgi:hypothetical protein